MSIVPLLFRDWWDDFEHERLPRRLLDQHFGLGLHRDDLFNMTSALSSPMITGAYYRPWQGLQLDRQNRGTSNLKFDDKQVQIILDVQQFKPEEITVKTSEGAVIVEGKHEEKQDEHGFISRQFKRRYMLPKDADIEKIVSTLSSDGMLTVSALKKEAQLSDERSIPIIQTGAPVAIASQTGNKEKSSKVDENKVEQK